MAAVPIIINGVLMPKGKEGGRGRSAHDEPVPCVLLGWASNPDLSVGGGPIIPTDTPIEPPIDPPPTDPGPNAVIVIKPAPATGGWGLAQDPSNGSVKWFYTPDQSGAGPKR